MLTEQLFRLGKVMGRFSSHSRALRSFIHLSCVLAPNYQARVKEVGTFCEACSPPRIPRYEGRNLVLERVDCNCRCPDTIFEPLGPRCPRCDHPVKIELTDDWKDPFLWIDPKTHGPVNLDQVKLPGA